MSWHNLSLGYLNPQADSIFLPNDEDYLAEFVIDSRRLCRIDDIVFRNGPGSSSKLSSGVYGYKHYSHQQGSYILLHFPKQLE
jgi:hypothetical protein